VGRTRRVHGVQLRLIHLIQKLGPHRSTSLIKRSDQEEKEKLVRSPFLKPRPSESQKKKGKRSFKVCIVSTLER
jgi:hypothetical protein